MRWWLRIVVTLSLAPLLWRLVTAYIANQQGTSWSDLAHQSASLLGSLYLTFTAPALVLCGILAICDFVLKTLGLDLITVFLSPPIAGVVAAGVVHFVREPHVQAAEGAVVLAVVYGLVWGLTIREPLARKNNRNAVAGSRTSPTLTSGT